MFEEQLNTYDVHIFAVVRVKVSGIRAHTQKNALADAEQAVDFDQLFNTERAEYAEEISHYLVDVAGDAEYEESQWFLNRVHSGWHQDMLNDSQLQYNDDEPTSHAPGPGRTLTVVTESEEFGRETFEYDTLEEAVEGIKRIYTEASRLADGVERIIGLGVNLTDNE